MSEISIVPCSRGTSLSSRCFPFILFWISFQYFSVHMTEVGTNGAHVKIATKVGLVVKIKWRRKKRSAEGGAHMKKQQILLGLKVPKTNDKCDLSLACLARSERNKSIHIPKY